MLQVPLERGGHPDVVADDVALVREVTGEPVHGAVGLLDEEAVAVELAHLRRELQREVVPPRLLTLAKLVRLRALAQAAKPRQLRKRLVLDALLDHGGHGFEAGRVAQQSLPIRDLEPLDLLGGLDFLLRSEHPMSDHLAEIARQGRISCPLPLELLEGFLALHASLFELLLARFCRLRRWLPRLRGRRCIASLGLDLRLLLGYLGPHLALRRRLSCGRCLSCHFSSRLPVAPR